MTSNSDFVSSLKSTELKKSRQSKCMFSFKNRLSKTFQFEKKMRMTYLHGVMTYNRNWHRRNEARKTKFNQQSSIEYARNHRVLLRIHNFIFKIIQTVTNLNF